MEIKMHPDELAKSLANSRFDGGLLVFDVPDDACLCRLSISGCRVLYGEKSIRLQPVRAAIISLVVNGTMSVTDVMSSVFIKSDKTLFNHLSAINTDFRKAQIPAALSGRGGQVEIVYEHF